MKQNGSNMDYKIIEETQYDGKKWYYVKKRYAWCFWKFLYSHRMGFHSLEEAQWHIQSDKETDWTYVQSKIKKRKVIRIIMEKIPTAEEFLNQKPFINGMTRRDQQIAMIEFAKLHVEAALKAASEEANAISSRSNITSKDRLKGVQGLICVHLGNVSVDKDSILNAYPLTNIK
jgi:hypothetical protein